MADSFVTYTGNGATVLYAITFPYIQQSDVEVYVDNVLKTVTTNYTFLSASSIQFVVAPINGASILIKRNTSTTTKLVDFTDGSILSSANLDLSTDQMFYATQELKDHINNYYTTYISYVSLPLPIFAASVASTGVFTYQKSISSTSKTATGTYKLSTAYALDLFNFVDVFMQATLDGGSGAGFITCSQLGTVGGNYYFEVKTYNTSGVLTDKAFNFTASARILPIDFGGGG